MHRVRLLAAVALALPAALTSAQDEGKEGFPEEVLGKPEFVETGKEVFSKTCSFCHGKVAYPGKGPPLKPSRYTPDFVYDRVTHGFRGMPPFKDVYSEKERQSVTAYVMSKQFAN